MVGGTRDGMVGDGREGGVGDTGGEGAWGAGEVGGGPVGGRASSGEVGGAHGGTADGGRAGASSSGELGGAGGGTVGGGVTGGPDDTGGEAGSSAAGDEGGRLAAGGEDSSGDGGSEGGPMGGWFGAGNGGDPGSAGSSSERLASAASAPICMRDDRAEKKMSTSFALHTDSENSGARRADPLYEQRTLAWPRSNLAQTRQDASPHQLPTAYDCTTRRSNEGGHRQFRDAKKLRVRLATEKQPFPLHRTLWHLQSVAHFIHVHGSRTSHRRTHVVVCPLLMYIMIDRYVSVQNPNPFKFVTRTSWRAKARRKKTELGHKAQRCDSS